MGLVLNKPWRLIYHKKNTEQKKIPKKPVHKNANMNVIPWLLGIKET